MKDMEQSKYNDWLSRKEFEHWKVEKVKVEGKNIKVLAIMLVVLLLIFADCLSMHIFNNGLANLFIEFVQKYDLGTQQIIGAIFRSTGVAEGIKLYLGTVLSIAIWSIIYLVITTPLHEFIHAICFMLSMRKDSNVESEEDIMSNIKFKFDILRPTTSVSSVMNIQGYRIAVAMPFIVLGIIPMIIACIFGQGWLLFFGWLGLGGGGYDIISLIMLSKYSNAEVFDGVGFVGCMVAYPIENYDKLAEECDKIAMKSAELNCPENYNTETTRIFKDNENE